jgi:outer membrane lipoprotein LolB
MPPQPESRQPRELTAFAVEGRISVRQADRSYHANIAWRHAADADEIFLTTPLGQGIAELLRDASGARLIQADRREIAAPDWEALSSEIFGFRLPLADLPRWIVGHRPAAGTGWRGPRRP